jgi:hypothetical protein
MMPMETEAGPGAETRAGRGRSAPLKLFYRFSSSIGTLDRLY